MNKTKQKGYEQFYSFLKTFLNLVLSSKGIEPLVDYIQFFYREPPLPIGSPAP